MTIGVVFHIIFGSIGLLSGFIALFSKKGARNHKTIGIVFVISMLLMAITGFYYALVHSVTITMLAALLTCYLVCTSWLSVQKRISFGGRTGSIFSVLSGLIVVLYGSYLCVSAFNGVTDSLGEYSVPPVIYLIFTAIALMALISDIRQVLFGEIPGAHRIMRHLWRMCLSLYIACSSFFQGQQQVFPESWQGTIYLSIPEFSVLLVMLFWLLRFTLQKYRKTPKLSPE